jgi:NB-ARC domain/Rx N-terminal domain
MAEIAATMAVDWAVSSTIVRVLEKIQTYISNNFFQNAGIEDEMKRMKTTLTEILSVMGTVEEQKILDPHQAQLVREIKDVIYDAEDIMDKFEYNVLREKSPTFSRVIYQFIVGNNKFKKKVTEVNDGLDRAKVSAETLLQLMHVSHTFNIHRFARGDSYVSSSRIIEKIVGRERECEDLINLLFKQVDESFTLIPIVGHGGIGKTTLAQIVYNNKKVQDHFERIWVSVSDNFNKDRLIREMLKQISKNISTIDASFEMLQNELSKSIASKNKILLVLDDIWYDRNDTEQYSFKKEWLEVLSPFHNAKPGSKIILTTRQPLVGKILGTIQPVLLNGLNLEDSWSLLKLCAFDHQN